MRQLYLLTIVTFFLILFQTSFAQIPTNGLVSYYPFNGNANDESGNGHIGTQVNTVPATDRFGAAEKAMLFNGTDAYINLGSNFDFHESFSISFYAKTLSNTGSNPSLISQGIQDFNKGLHIMLGNSYFRFDFWGNSPLDCNVNFPLVNQWAFWAFTYDAATNSRKIYLNGNLICSDNPASDCLSVGDVLLGRVTFDNPLNVHYHGVLDEVRIYNRALSNVEVNQLYQAGVPPADITKGLVAHYPFDGNANDVSGNGNHSVVKGAVLTEDRNNQELKSYKFDGITSHLSANASASLNLINETDDVSIAFWVKLDIINGVNGFYINKGNEDGIHFRFYGQESLSAFQVGDQYSHVSFLSALQANKWYHISGIKQANRLHLYLNGIYQGQSTFNSVGYTINFSAPLEIGRDIHGPDEYTQGALDEIRIYKRALLPSEVETLYYSEVPTKVNFSAFSFSKSQIGGNQTMLIQGNGFSANSGGRLTFSGESGEYEKEFVTDANGRFTFIYAIPENATSGFVNVRAFDINADQFCTQIKTFEIIDLSSPKNYLQLDKFIAGTQYKVGRKVSMGWDDKLLRNYGDYYYPIEPITGRRKFKYKVEIQTTENGPWELLIIEEGVGLVGGGVIRSVEKFFNTPTNYCRYRVTDVFVPEIMKVSDVFSFVEIGENVDVTLLWDKSFPTPFRSPRGVAADGVARLLVKVERKDKNAGFPILNATATITDPMYSDVKLIGKLMAASKTSEYDTEGNAAEFSSAISTVNALEDVWFWYVAPDNFCDGNASCDALSERSITIRVEVNFSNGAPQIVEIPMLIVRPPLVLVHGVASGPDTWDNFGYTGSLGNKTLFTDASWLYQIERIKLDGRGAFTANAVKLLSANWPNPSQNTLQGNIYAMRNIWGFACNQVDYVCHSMGGLVLRTAMTVLGNRFYGTGGSANDLFKTYGKGFVHKAVTINTPHWGSPVADLISEELPKLPWHKRIFINQIYYDYPNVPMLWDFIQPSASTLLGWETTPAIKDMQIENEGKDLLAVNVKSHLIVGDVNLLSKKAAEALKDQLPFYKFMKNLYTAAAEVPGPQKPILKAIGTGFEVLDALAFMEYYSRKKGFDNFLGDGDLVVPMKSQLAGLPEGANNVTVFENNSEGILNANHLFIKDRLDVGDRIRTLLNAPIESSWFGDGFPATPIKETDNEGGGGSWLVKGDDEQQTLLKEYIDTSKIKILSPVSFDSIQPDSILTISYRIKDTINLKFVETTFQGYTHTSLQRDSVQNFKTLINNSSHKNHLIIVTAVYNIGDSLVEYYSDTISASLKNLDILTAFKIKTKSFSVTVNDEITPECYAIFQESILSVSSSDNEIEVSFSNVGLVDFNKALGKFRILADSGATYAVVAYKGFSDTIFFSINRLSSSYCINRTTSSGLFSNPANWSKGIVPGACDSIVVMPGHSIIIDTSLTISAVYIAPSASLTLDSTELKIVIGGSDEGNRVINNWGALNIFRGQIFLNGNIQLQSGSSYIQNGGHFTIDGNNLFSSTSVSNGLNLFYTSPSVANFSFSGGVLQIVDPPLGINSQSISCPFNFGDNSTLIFGDGISTTPSNNPNGFGGNLLPARIGELIIDTKSLTGNRHFINLNPISAKSPVQILSGELIQKARFEVRQ